jgi:(p)ppGpp synthase/HD superfamily hydrolase
MTLPGPFVPDERRKIGRRFTEALVLAAELHAGQRRKGHGPPYVAHLLGVTALAFDFGATEDEAIAALLHDAIEDAPKDLGANGVRRLILEQFGTAVLDIVEDCTDSDAVPKEPWHERKHAYVAHVASVGASALLVSAADKLHNVRAIVRDYRLLGDALWARFSPDAGMTGTVGYYRGLVNAFRVRERDASPGFHRLLTELEAEVETLEQLTGHQGRWPL